MADKQFQMEKLKLSRNKYVFNNQLSKAYSVEDFNKNQKLNLLIEQNIRI